MTNDNTLDDRRVLGYDPLISPELLQSQLPLSENAKKTVESFRKSSTAILNGTDDRLLVIVGPCSIHDPAAALEYGKRLKQISDSLSDTLVIVMRSYFEKPRTTVGWKGLINDPEIDGTFKINSGLFIARKILCDLNDQGTPVGCELLDTISPQFIGDLISWGAIGARTTESQLHRELASGVSFPLGFKNGTDGSINIAIDAVHAASHPHHFLGVTKQGLAAITKTKGNDTCHVILRGGKTGPNYYPESIKLVETELLKNKLQPKIMVDMSHGNSSKNHENQKIVCSSLCEQIAHENDSIFGVMIESNINAGNQKIPKSGKDELAYGISITDACVSFDDTIIMLNQLSAAVDKKRIRVGSIEK